MVRDKVWHTLANMLIVGIVGYFIGIYWGWIAAVVVSIGKELVDKYFRKTVFSGADLYADVIGIVMGTVLLLIIVG